MLKCHFDVNVITVVQFYMFMVHTVMLTYLAQMCTRDRKKRGLIFFLCKCSLWVLRQSSAYFQNAQKHKSIFCAFASSFCHSCVHICIYFSNIYYQRAIRASFFFLMHGCWQMKGHFEIISEYCKTGLLVMFDVTERRNFTACLCRPPLFFLLPFIH